jgi:hypothetical protein
MRTLSPLAVGRLSDPRFLDHAKLFLFLSWFELPQLGLGHGVVISMKQGAQGTSKNNLCR